MNRIAIPTNDTTPAASGPLLGAVQKKLGVTPNLMKLLGNSPAALEGYLSLSGSLGKGSLGAQTGERIALAVAQYNGCQYCLSAHAYLGKHVAKLSDMEIAANRNGASTDAKAGAAVRFALCVAQERGSVADADIAAVKAAGFTDAEVVEIVTHVALNVLTNYINQVAQTEIDFPDVTLALAA